jgi:hypothetical protein
MDFWEGDDDMDVDTLTSIESNDPIDDIDLSFREEDSLINGNNTTINSGLWRVCTEQSTIKCGL